MHADAAASVFGGAPTHAALLRLAALAVALLVNASSSVVGSGLLLVAGIAVVVRERVRLDRVRVALASATVSTGVLVISAAWAGGRGAAALLGVRAGSAAVWIVWFAATVSWPALRDALRASGVPATILESAETGVVHGLVLLGGLQRKHRAAVVRSGGRRLQVDAWGQILAAAFESALRRGAALGVARALRGARSADVGVAPPPAPETRSPVVELRRATRARRGGKGLADVDLSVADGEWVVVAGANGSGKTTMLEVLAGVEHLDEGRLERFAAVVDGRLLSRRADPRVGLVCHDPDDQLLGATPLEDVRWGLRQRGIDDGAATARAHAILAEFCIADLAEEPLSSLSFGQRRRAALAAVLACSPRLLLCDEPTSGLDPVAAWHLFGALERAAGERSLTVVITTHDLAALPARFARVVLLRDGRVVFDGPRHEALEPARLRAAGLLPDPPTIDGAGAEGSGC